MNFFCETLIQVWYTLEINYWKDRPLCWYYEQMFPPLLRVVGQRWSQISLLLQPSIVSHFIEIFYSITYIYVYKFTLKHHFWRVLKVYNVKFVYEREGLMIVYLYKNVLRRSAFSRRSWKRGFWRQHLVSPGNMNWFKLLNWVKLGRDLRRAMSLCSRIMFKTYFHSPKPIYSMAFGPR